MAIRGQWVRDRFSQNVGKLEALYDKLDSWSNAKVTQKDFRYTVGVLRDALAILLQDENKP